MAFQESGERRKGGLWPNERRRRGRPGWGRQNADVSPAEDGADQGVGQGAGDGAEERVIEPRETALDGPEPADVGAGRSDLAVAARMAPPIVGGADSAWSDSAWSDVDADAAAVASRAPRSGGGAATSPADAWSDATASDAVAGAEPAAQAAKAAAVERSGDALARLCGWTAAAAAAMVLFAPAAIFALMTTNAPTWTLAAPALAALPLIAVAAAALIRPAAPLLFALAHAPIVGVAAWLTWSSGGATSPMAPWTFAALAALIVLGGRRVVFWTAVAAGAALAAALWLAPIAPMQLIGYAPRADRELVSLVAWLCAGAALAAAAWAAHTSWISALPPLRQPTIAARRALSALSEDAAVAAVRVGADGVACEVYGSTEAAFGLPARDLTSAPLEALVHPDDRPSFVGLMRSDPQRAAGETALAATERGGGAAAIQQLRLRSQYGAFRWVEATLAAPGAYPIQSEGRRASAIWGRAPAASAPDDRILVLRARRRRGDSGRVDADRAGLLAHVHDGLRRELTTVVGYSDMLKNEIFGPLGADRYREYAALAHDGGAHLLELVDELLELAAVDAGRVGADAALIDPIPVIEGAARLAKRRAERRGVALETDAPPTTPHLRTDRRALRRVLVNLFLDTARRCSVGDVVFLQVQTEPDAISFKFFARQASSAPGRAPAERDAAVGSAAAGLAAGDARAPALIGRADERADMDGVDETDGCDSNAEGVTELGEARLGRLVAISLAERLSGGLLFADGESAFERLGDPRDGQARLIVEAIFPIGSAAKIASDKVATTNIAPPEAPARRVPAPVPARAPAAPPSPAAAGCGGGRPDARALARSSGQGGQGGAGDGVGGGAAGAAPSAARPAEERPADFRTDLASELGRKLGRRLGPPLNTARPTRLSPSARSLGHELRARHRRGVAEEFGVPAAGAEAETGREGGGLDGGRGLDGARALGGGRLEPRRRAFELVVDAEIVIDPSENPPGAGDVEGLDLVGADGVVDQPAPSRRSRADPSDSHGEDGDADNASAEDVDGPLFGDAQPQRKSTPSS